MIQLANIFAAAAKTTRTQRTARRLMIAGCSIIGLGVMGTMVASAFAQKQPPTHFVAESPSLSAMASTKVTKAQSNQTSVAGGVELMHDAVQAAGNTHVVRMNVTAYCPCPKCCGKNAQGLTASGKPISFDGGHFVAAPAKYAFGTKLVIEGYNDGQPVQVLDRGGAIKGNHLDVFFPTHEQAKAWGRRWIDVVVAD
jgi:3D (Asp-Asp-Asp) domain-containing protein